MVADRTDEHTSTGGRARALIPPSAGTPLPTGSVNEVFDAVPRGGIGQVVYRFCAESIDVHRMEKAWHEAASGHVDLSATGPNPTDVGSRQRALPESFTRVGRAELGRVDRPDGDDRLDQWLIADRLKGFDVKSDPVMRLVLLEAEGRPVALVCSFQHLLLGGASASIVLEDALVRYDELDPSSPLVAAGDPIADGRFMGARRGVSEFRLPSTWVAQVEARSPLVDGSVEAAVLVAWSVLLARWNDTSHVVFGLAGNGRVSGDRLLRLNPTKDLLVDRLLREVAAHRFSAIRQANSSTAGFELRADADSGPPTPSTAVAFDPQHSSDRNPAGGGVRERRSFHLIEPGPIALMVTAQVEDGLGLRLEFDDSAHDPAVVDRLGSHLTRLLESIASAPSEAVVADLEMLPHSERKALLDGRNPPEWAAVAGSWIDHFEAQVQLAPDRIAVESMEDGTTISYSDLDRRANRIARLLLGCAADPAHPIALCMQRSIDFVAAVVATRKAGRAFLALDPTYPADALRYRLHDSRASILVATSATAAMLSGAHQELIVLDDQAAALERLPSTPPSREDIDPSQPAYVIYTSGTTGRPKGVVVSDQSLVDLSQAVGDVYELVPSDRVLQFAGLSFDVSVEEIMPTLLAGATVVLRDDVISSSMADFVDASAKQRLSVLNLPSAVWHTLVEHLAREGARLSRTVRLTVVGGEKVSRNSYQRWSAIHPEVRWLNGYGPTETTVTCTTFDPAAGFDPQSGRELPIGHPLPNARVYVLDSAGDELMPDGADGELWVGGSGVALGYLDRPELTAERFRSDPFVDDPAARMYRTGDRVRWGPDGELEFIGRVDRQIKLRGFRIEPGHIESRLEAIAGVSQAFVALRPGSTGLDRLIGWFVPDGGEEPPDPGRIRDELRAQLPTYMVPSCLIKVDDLPRTVSTKIDVDALPDPVVSPSRASDPEVLADSAVAVLCQIFGSLLAADLGPDDSFFDHGGTSLIAVRVIDEVEKQLAAPVTLQMLISAPTARSLAASLAEGPGRGSQAYVTAIQPGGSRPPIYGLHILGENASFYRPLAGHLGADQPLFGVAIARPDEHTPTQVPEIAAMYTREIQRHRPDGPVVVAGISLAGFVAFEVAQQLAALGRDVLLVVMLDAAGPGGARSVALVRRVQIHLSRLVANPVPYLRRLLGAIAGSARELSWTLRVKVTHLLGHRTPEDLWVHRFVLANVESVGSYQPTGSLSPLLVVHAAEEEFDDPEMVEAGFGWGPYADAGIEVVEVPGDHMSMLAEPHARQLADAIGSALERRSRRVGHLSTTSCDER